MDESGRYAGVELGGTKAIAVLAQGRTIVDRLVVPTTDPAATLDPLLARLEAWHADAALGGVGLATFGPVRLRPGAGDHGRILATPKPGWSGAAVLAPFAERLDCPIAIDTDVNAAALAEHRWGAGRGCTSLVYVTIGTGIGAGIVVNGRPIHGRLHPEAGHLLLRRDPSDSFAGTCPFHGDCAEGLLSGPALAARFGQAPTDVAPDDPRWLPLAQDLAHLLAALIHIASPERLLVGGGVGLGAAHLLQAAVERLPALLAGYYPDLDHAALSRLVTAPDLGAEAGPLGAIALARLARGEDLDAA